MTQEQCCTPPSNLNGHWTSLQPHERIPYFLVVTQENPHMSCCSSKKKQDSPFIVRWGPSVPAGPREQSGVLSQNSTGGLTPFMPVNVLQEIAIATREESGFLFFHSRRGLTPRVKLECNPEIPVTIGEKHGVSGHKPRWGLFALHWFESNPQLPLATQMEIGLPWANTRGSLSFPS